MVDPADAGSAVDAPGLSVWAELSDTDADAGSFAVAGAVAAASRASADGPRDTGEMAGHGRVAGG